MRVSEQEQRNENEVSASDTEKRGPLGRQQDVSVSIQAFLILKEMTVCEYLRDSNYLFLIIE